jgi:hypothetical protein
MERLINFSTVSAVTVLSMVLALFIEMALLKVVFSCLARVKADSAEREFSATPGRHWIRPSAVNDLRNAGM